MKPAKITPDDVSTLTGKNKGIQFSNFTQKKRAPAENSSSHAILLVELPSDVMELVFLTPEGILVQNSWLFLFRASSLCQIDKSSLNSNLG